MWENLSKDDFIRVGLAYGANAPASCEIYSESGFILGFMEDGGLMDGLPLTSYKRLTIKLSGRYVTALADGVLISDDLGSSGCVLPYDYRDGGVISFAGASYRGGLSFRSNTNNTVTVINLLPFEQYLYGVLNSEMGRTSPEEALKAQAVVSRSYAKHELGSHAGDGFDVCTSVHCQVYKGYSGEYAETTAAVDNTAGQILSYEGKVISANFFKNSGGYTQNSEDVWGDSLDYLRGVKDEFSPDYPWSWSISFSDLSRTLASNNMNCGEISSVEVSARNANGYVKELKVTGSRGTIALKKEQIRNVLGASNVKSLNFNIGSEGAGQSAGGNSGEKNEGGAKAPVIYISNGQTVKNAAGDVYAISAADGSDKVTRLKLNSVSVLGAEPTETAAQSAPGSGASDGARSASASASGGTKTASASASGGTQPASAVSSSASTVGAGNIAAGGRVVFTGLGFGHGVGMPQDSAIEMAKQGYSYTEILNKFYTGVQL
jgi:stage II sporulation protein D